MTENNQAASAASPSVTEVLQAARERVAKGWCRDHNAVDANGEEIDCFSDQAASWCAYGAIQCTPDDDVEYEAERLLEQAIGGEWRFLTSWNDDPGRTQAEVLAAFDKAIALSEEAANEESDARNPL